MSAARQSEELIEQINALVRQYGLSKYGQVPLSWSLKLCDGRKKVEPIPALPELVDADRPTPAAVPEAWATGSVPRVTDGFRQVYWPRLGLFRFSVKQALVIGRLWRAREDGESSVSEDDLLKAADSDGRLRDLFRNHPGWRSLVVHDLVVAGYRLPQLPDDED